MEKTLITNKDIPTHRLVIKKTDGEFKTIYLTENQLSSVIKNINSPDQFIIIGLEYFPKFASQLEKLSQQEIKDMQSRYYRSFEDIRKEEEEKRKEQERKIINEWVKNNPQEWKKMKKMTHDELQKKGRLPHEGLGRIAMIHSMARIKVRKKL